MTDEKDSGTESDIAKHSDNGTTPDYLNPKCREYPPKLAAAVKAWEYARDTKKAPKGTIPNPAHQFSMIRIEDTDFWKEMNENRVGNLLAAARLKKGLTQRQLADAAGVKQNMVSGYEKGRRRLTMPMAKRFADILDINPARLA